MMFESLSADFVMTSQGMKSINAGKIWTFYNSKIQPVIFMISQGRKKLKP